MEAWGSGPGVGAWDSRLGLETWDSRLGALSLELGACSAGLEAGGSGLELGAQSSVIGGLGSALGARRSGLRPARGFELRSGFWRLRGWGSVLSSALSLGDGSGFKHRAWGLGFMSYLWVIECRLGVCGWGLGFRARSSGLWAGEQGLGAWLRALGAWASGLALGARSQGTRRSVFKAHSSRLRVWGWRLGIQGLRRERGHGGGFGVVWMRAWEWRWA